MPLPRQVTKTPDSIEDISIELYQLDDGDGTFTPGARYSVQVRYSDGDLDVITGDLVPHLTPAQINTLLTFIADMRTKAEAEVLPQ